MGVRGYIHVTAIISEDYVAHLQESDAVVICFIGNEDEHFNKKVNRVTK